MLAGIRHRPDRLHLAREDRLHRAVVAIAHPSAQTTPAGLVLHPAAEEHALYLAPDTHVHRPHLRLVGRSEEHTSELQSLMRISYAVFCLTKKNDIQTH